MSGLTHAVQLAPRVGDLRQIASVRRIQLDDGPERGVRALAFSTGGGLDFWALSDRTLDIGPLWWRGVPLAWQNPLGFAAPSQLPPAHDAGLHIARMLSGFMMTCGLEHIRQPANGNPLHGRLPGSPVNVTAYGEEWSAAQPYLYAEGTTALVLPDDGVFRFTRRIEALIGRTAFSIADMVENIGDAPRELAVLYHINFGYPAVSGSTAVSLNGAPLFPFDDAQARGSIQCVSSASAGQRDAVVQLRTDCWEAPDDQRRETVTIALSFPSAALPWLQVWNDPRPRRNILAVEPANCGRRADGTSEKAPVLEPGEQWHSRLDLRISAA